ncbi:hypothetical protein [Desulfuromonas thiophila]|uniref:hypothetical protein n=1 Tax=Desulfuromonas thiophila TaxID=57664 RepID=UPI00115F93A1|nr:hypothetical protein [Desulfuromonas thiophila]
MRNDNQKQLQSTQRVHIMAPATTPAPAPPVLHGWLVRDVGVVYVWCPWCRRYHIHGAPDGDLAPLEHRAAHCGDHRRRGRSPYHATGYRIRIDHRLPPPPGPGWRGRAAWCRALAPRTTTPRPRLPTHRKK